MSSADFNLTSSPIMLTKFTLFPKLPTELRHLIWRLSLPARIVELFGSDNCLKGICSQALIPSTLQVCRESRQAVEDLYPLCFGSILQPETIRFNFQLDTLYFNLQEEQFNFRHTMGLLKETELGKMERLAFDSTFFFSWGETGSSEYTTNMLVRAINLMGSLNELIIVEDITEKNPNMNDWDAMRLRTRFYTHEEAQRGGLTWPATLDALPDVNDFIEWKRTDDMTLRAVYASRSI